MEVSRRGSASSYLAGRDELQRAQSALHVGDVVLEVLEGIVDGRLDFRGRGPRRAVGGNLGELRHDGGGVEMWCRLSIVEEVAVEIKVGVFHERKRGARRGQASADARTELARTVVVPFSITKTPRHNTTLHHISRLICTYIKLIYINYITTGCSLSIANCSYSL